MKKEEIFNLPELPKLTKLSTYYMALRYFTGSGSSNRIIHGMVANYIRLVDQSVCTYTMAREFFLSFMNNNKSLRFGLLLSGLGQLELCIYSIDRALKFAKIIFDDNNNNIPKNIKECFPLDRKIIPDITHKKIHLIRNRIEHYDEDFKDKKLNKDKSLMLYPQSTFVEIGNYKLLYSDILECICKLHLVAKKISKFRET